MRTPAKECFLLSLSLRGWVPEEAFPPYLSKEGVKTIKERLNRIQIVTQDVTSYLKEQPENSFDCFSLSDVASFMSRDDFIDLLEQIIRTSRPGARISIRQFLSDYKIPKQFESKIERDNVLEKELWDTDRCFLYRFTIGTIQKR